ncbi:ParB/Srx family N-terminal domain-containing protein [Vibrio rumoiensis]|uniref:Chromosome partitioning protein ParB n=1 Tax=Vibrio rumoiensis 1S-45 TaxID=1188252 RepID=A0A1E5E288_9VIBR|nr:ParB/Srx family N-terminal domain-containing protein [Vibrio rumoiensis]OEF25514.1 chromosome partitioning protein ParB [Vibrio rumoiensis 1S-45]
MFILLRFFTRFLFIVFTYSFLVLPAYAAMPDIHELKTHDVVKVSLSDLYPTQALIGGDQVRYKLANYQKNPEKMFDDVCEANGQKGVKSFDQNSKANQPQTFECLEAIGTEKQDIKTVVIAPNDQLYLTDGHHTFTTFWAMPQGGANFPIRVIVTKDYRNLKDMPTFWQQMKDDKYTWLFGVNGEPISPESLPKQLALDKFQDDTLRSMMYFAKGVSWDKPDVTVPFLEFYWAKALAPMLTDAPNTPDFINKLDTETGYIAAFEQINNMIISLKGENIGGSGLTAQQMGQLNKIKQKKEKKQINKIKMMLAFKQSEMQ